MSVIVDDDQDERDLADMMLELIALNKAQVFLLEIIASVEIGETIEMFEE